MESITFLMLEEHRRIRRIFNEFEKEGDLEKRKLLCDRFKWAIQKHIFVEEKAIFSFSQDIAGQLVSDIFKLMDEHGELLNIITGIEEGLDENAAPSVHDLRELLQAHEGFEEEKFYPKLDHMLNNQQKTELIERIKEIVH